MLFPLSIFFIFSSVKSFKGGNFHYFIVFEVVLDTMNFLNSSNTVLQKYQNPCYSGTPRIFLCVIQVCNFSTLQGIIIFVPRSQSPHANMPISIFWRKQFWVELETDERVVFVVLQLKIRQSIAAVQCSEGGSRYQKEMPARTRTARKWIHLWGFNLQS